MVMEPPVKSDDDFEKKRCHALKGKRKPYRGFRDKSRWAEWLPVGDNSSSKFDGDGSSRERRPRCYYLS